MKLLAVAIALGVTCSAEVVGADTRCQVFPPGGYVGVYADSLGQDSTIVLAAHPGLWEGTFHVLAVLNGAVASGIIGAQFRVHLPLAPTGMFITTTPTSDLSYFFGDPLTIGAENGGVILAFNHCAHGYVGAAGKVVVPLAKVNMLTLESFDTPVYVQKLAPPDPRAPCPIFARCDGTSSPAPMVLRGTDSADEDYAFSGRLFCEGGTVNLRASSWGRIKSLYR